MLGRLFAVAFLVAAWAAPLAAQNIAPQTYAMHLPYDRGIDFAMAVTRQGDMFSLIASEDGHWKLIRVRHWDSPQPIEDQLVIESFTSKEARGLSIEPIQLFPSTDGRYLFAITSGWHNVHHQYSQESMQAVVDLTSFKVLTISRETDGAQTTWSQESNGAIVRRAFENNEDRHGVGNKVFRATILTFPDLASSAPCSVTDTWIARVGMDSRVVAGCDDLLAAAGLASLDDLIPAGHSTALDERREVTRRVGASDTVDLSPDRRFAFNLWSRRRDGFPFGVVTAAQGLEIFALQPDATLAKLQIDRKSSAKASFASSNGKDFLLLVKDGTQLDVYALPPHETASLR
jgi:hypothetical protein